MTGSIPAKKQDRENRDQTIASLYLGVLVDLVDVDWALAEDQQVRIARAFEAAQEAAKRELGDARFRVETDA